MPSTSRARRVSRPRPDVASESEFGKARTRRAALGDRPERWQSKAASMRNARLALVKSRGKMLAFSICESARSLPAIASPDTLQRCLMAAEEYLGGRTGKRAGPTACKKSS